MNIKGQISPFQYLGAKYSVLPWLLPLLPESYSFVDVFGGSGVVLMNRKPSPVETYNDINGNVVNFFQVLRSRKDELVRVLELTPHSKKEYDDAWYAGDDDPIERARKFFVRNRQSFLSAGSQSKGKGWATTTYNSRVNMSEATSKWIGSIDGLARVANRLRGVQIENRSWDWVIETYDHERCLFYCDPPYDSEHRSSGNDYEFDFTEEDHRKLSASLQVIKGKAAVSGYDSVLMKELYKGWQFHQGPIRKNNYSKKQNVRECLWTNYDAHSKKLTLF